ncbi:MAG: hypothetical protein PWP65_1095 [Clostridia bacterium]|nr:hypothetical protein [Clostridia bacterium]
MREFLNEAHEQLDMLEQLLLKLEWNDRGAIDAVFRIAHTLKGSAACVGLKDVAEFAHKMENLLDAIRKGEVLVSQGICSLLLQSGDVLRALIRGVEEGIANCAPPEYNKVVSELERASGGGSSPAKNDKPCVKLFVRVTLDNSSEMRAARAFVILKRLEEIGRLEFARPSEGELMCGRVLPDAMTVVLESEIEGREVYERLAGYPDVTDVDVRYMLQIRDADWERYKEYGDALESEGKHIALDFMPGAVKLDVNALRFIGEALRHGWLLHSRDDLTCRVLSRMTMKEAG